jgi:hypothetical protein
MAKELVNNAQEMPPLPRHDHSYQLQILSFLLYQILASIPTGTLYKHFSNMLDDLWLLWELVLLGEPLVVIAPEPGICSESVVALIDLINPVSEIAAY